MSLGQARMDQRQSNAFKRVLDVGLLVVALIWVAAMWGTDLEFGPYGILPSFSPLWYAAALGAFAGLVAAIARRFSVHAATFMLLLAMFIALPPFILEKTVRFQYIFDSYRYAEALSQAGRIDYSQSYLAWPGWHIISFATVEAGRWSLPSFAQWSSVILGVVSGGVGVMLLLRLTGGGRLFWTALIAAAPLLGGLSYPLPGTMAGLIWIATLNLVLDEHIARKTASAGRRLLIMILMAGVVVTHLLTTVVMISSLMLMPLAGRIFGRRRLRVTLGLFGASVLLVFLFYMASATTAQLLPAQITAILNLDDLFRSTVTTTTGAMFGGSDEHTKVVLIRVAYVVIAAALAALAFVVGLWRRRHGESSWWLPASLVAAGSTTLAIGPYSGEIIIRAYTFAALGIVPMVGRLVNRHSAWVLLPIFAIGVALAPVNAYGNEFVDHVRAQELAADRFVVAHGPETYRLKGASRTLLARWMPPSVSQPVVTVTGNLYRPILRFLRASASPPSVRSWQYDNGGVQVSIGNGP